MKARRQELLILKKEKNRTISALKTAFQVSQKEKKKERLRLVEENAHRSIIFRLDSELINNSDAFKATVATNTRVVEDILERAKNRLDISEKALNAKKAKIVQVILQGWATLSLDK